MTQSSSTSTNINAQRVYDLVKQGSPEQLDQLLDSLPESFFTNAARPLLQTDHIGMRVVALSNLAIAYCNGQEPNIGSELAAGLHSLAVELYMQHADHAGLIETSLSALAYAYANALNLMSQSEKVLSFTDEWIPFYTDQVAEAENISSLYIARANALLNLNQIDAAEAIVQNKTIPWNYATDIERNRLDNKIAQWKGRITAVQAPETKKGNEAIATALGKLNESSNSIPGLENIMQQLNSGVGFDAPSSIDEFKQLLDTIDQGENLLTKGTSQENEFTIKKMLRDATSLFYINPKPDATSIQQSIHKLDRVFAWASQQGNNEILNDAYWGYYLCYSRLQNDNKAADNLILLRHNIEKMREGILNPLERGGAFSTYPNLFSMSVEKLYRAGRYDEMLESIEAAKGRAIADLLTRNSSKITRDQHMYACLAELGQLSQTFEFNYLSFFVDDYEGESTIYSVLVDKQGKHHANAPIKLSTEQINQAVSHLNPKQWDRPDPINPGIKIPNARKILAPLGPCFEDYIQQQVLVKDDHIVISGDNQLNNIPWYYLPVFDEDLIQWFSVSRVHNAYQLHQRLQRNPIRPTRVSALVLPKQTDLQDSSWETFKASLYEPVNYLSEQIKLTTDSILDNQAVTLDNIQTHINPKQLLHISTHGFFPDKNSQLSPYHHSGLLLSDGEQLPTDACALAGDCLLTPEKIMQHNMRFDDCHISLMACVGGLSREGLGGDALGLEWAFIQAGAESLISAHWYVESNFASEFFCQFYNLWYLGKQSRAQALRNTCLQLQAQTKPHAWAVFILSGDWR